MAIGRRRVRIAARVAAASPLLLTLALAACGDAGGAPVDASVDGLPRLSLVEDLRVGSVDDPALGFSEIGDVAVADDGSMVVLEEQAQEVRVYGPDGSLLRRFGGDGSGPGEFRSAGAMTLVGDTVAVAEVTGNSRMTLFDLEGNLGRTFPMQTAMLDVADPSVTLMARPYRMRADGRFDALVATRVNLGPDGAIPVRPDSVMVPRILFGPEGSPSDTTGWYPMRFGRVVSAGGTAVAVAPMLPEWELAEEAAGDSVIIRRPAATRAGPAVFTVTRLRPGGDTVYHRRIGYTPIPVTQGYRDSLIEGRLEAYRNRPPPIDMEAIRRTLETELEWPAFHPPVRAVRVGAGGELWLLREAVDGATRTTVLRADGTPRGDVVLPSRLTLYQIAGDRIWGAWRDELDVPWLVRYRIGGG